MTGRSRCAGGRELCYGGNDMDRRIPVKPAVTRMTACCFLKRVSFAVAALALCMALVACSQTAVATPESDYGATVEALLPTAEPTVPPTPTLPPTPTWIPPTDTPAPTYTPRPQPTYTPRPTPTPATTEERQPAIPFNAQMLDGSEFSLADGYGSPTLLAFWAPW